MDKNYKLEVSPEVLELLGPSLYTNIYYVLAELIANGYDADANNVWIGVEDDKIYVEDDGHGMSYEKNEINQFLAVAHPSRSESLNEFTKKYQRPRMGRKGVGKLAALSVSEEVRVYSTSEGEKSGFVLTRKVPSDGMLEAIPENEIHFKNIFQNGTRIEMVNPQYSLPKLPKTVASNLAKFFPQVNKDFKIIISISGKKEVLNNSQKYMGGKLDTLAVFGKGFDDLIETFPDKDTDGYFFSQSDEVKLDVEFDDSSSRTKRKMSMPVRGWIGTYKSTRGQKKNQSDFPDNYVAIYSHGKLGQFNTLTELGRNKLYEVYLVGEFFVDSFEDSEFPDMALSNRQGYKTDDPRYIVFSQWLKERIADSVQRKQNVTKKRKKIEGEEKKTKKIRQEEELRGSVNDATEKIDKILKDDGSSPEQRKKNQKVIADALTNVGLKVMKTQEQMRRILISQTAADYKISNCVYSLLLFNGFDPTDILYTNSEDEASHIPFQMEIYDYLREFFAQSFTNKPLYVIYIDSEKSVESRGVQMEVGAGWVSQADYGIVKCGNEIPKEPLNSRTRFAEIREDDDGLFLTDVQFTTLYQIIKTACEMFGMEPKSTDENKKELQSLVEFVDEDERRKRTSVNRE